MIPLHDDNPTSIRPWVTGGLIAACVIVFLWQIGHSAKELDQIFRTLGFIPAAWFAGPGEVGAVARQLPLVTSMFLHGGLLHLAGNMLYLWIFGNNVEEAMGHGRFLIFYLVCGIAAALAQAYQAPGSSVPMVGASGAIGGVLSAYFLLHPLARVLVVVPLGLFFWTARIPAYFVLGVWFVFQLVMGGGAVADENAGGAAYWAHVGGFLAGMALLPILRRRGVRIWDTRRRPLPKPPRRRGPWG